MLQRMAKRLDRTIELLQRQRQKLIPTEAGGAKGKVANAPDASKSRMYQTKRGPLLRSMLGATMLLAGIIAGAAFSYNLFARKIESQADFIASQAEEVFEYEKMLRRAERALEKSRDETKETLEQLEQTSTALQQAQNRLAEIEGRAALYGSKNDYPASSAASNGIPAATRLAPRYRQRQMPERTCELGSASASSDLSRCLNQSKR